MIINIDPYVLDFKNIEDEIKPILVNVETACKLTNIGRNRMLNFCKMRGFPAIMSKGKFLIDRDQLKVWLSKNYGYYK